MTKLERAWEIALDDSLRGTAKRTDALLDLTEAACRRSDQMKRARRWWNPRSRWRAWRATRDWVALSGELQHNEQLRVRKERHVWVQG